MEEAKEKNNEKFPYEMDFKVSSMCDQTGLLPSGYGTEEELNTLSEMYTFMQEPIVNKEHEKV